MDDSEPSTPSDRLAADHREIDALFLEASAAMDSHPAAAAHAALDRVWMRLAVHVRAEHKVLFPALAETRPELGGQIQVLREDHDFFMSSLMEGVRSLQDPSPDRESAKAAMEAVRARLASHNALEELQIYPAADQLGERQRTLLFKGIMQELAFLPRRYRP